MFCCAIVLLSVFIIFRYLIEDWRTFVQSIKSITSADVDLRQRYGDWAVITGASDGIGKAYAEELALRKINIVLIGRNRVKLQDVATDLEGRHGITTRIVIADFAQGRGIYEKLKKDLDGLQVGILVNNVGIQYKYPMAIAELPEDEIWDNVHVNITSTTMMTRMILPQMMERKQGAIVNISSTSALQPQPYMNLYAASKTYVSYFSEALRSEVRSSGITVQTLEPMYVSSKINHFVEVLRKVDLFIPDVNTYAYYAVRTLGKIDKTTGYWPHTLQRLLYSLVPVWLRTRALEIRYRAYGRKYLRNLAAANKADISNKNK